MLEHFVTGGVVWYLVCQIIGLIFLVMPLSKFKSGSGLENVLGGFYFILFGTLGMMGFFVAVMLGLASQ